MRRKILYALSLAAVIALFVINALLSYGYDDEVYNFFMVEKLNSVSSIISYANSTDFHPSGMYIINYLMLKLFGSWSLVKAAGAFLSAFSVWLYWYFMSRNIRGNMVLFFSFIVICLNPSVLMWCTSVRWYKYIMPLICVISLLIHFSGRENFKPLCLWGIYFLACLLMFHINYLSAVVIIISFLFMLYGRRKFLRSEWKCVAGLSILSLLLVSYQAYILLTVHYAKSRQAFQFLRFSVAGAMNYLQGSAIIPVSAWGIMFIVANLILILVFLKNIAEMIRNSDNNFFMSSYASVMVLFPGAIKDVRNFTILSPELGMFLTNIYAKIQHKLLKILVLSLFTLGTAGGIFNVLTHNDTAKVTYNMPYPEIMKCVERLDPQKEALFITNLPGAYYFIGKNYPNAVLVPDGFAKSGIWAPFFPDWYSTLENWKGKIIAVRTHQGLVSKDDYTKYTEYLEGSNIIERHRIGLDRFASFKRRFYSEYPDYYARVYLIDNGGAQ